MCTVGLMLSGCTIEDTMPGSPSFLNGQIKGGDVIELVDNKSVSLDTLVDLIRGADRPGSKMELQLRGPDRTLKTIHLLRQPRTQVLERRDLFLMLDEMRSMASSNAMEQRGKKKPDENLIRFLNKTIEDLTAAIRKVEKFEHAAQTKERELRDFIDRVGAVTNQYLGRLDHALASSADDNAESLELVKSDDTTDVGQRARENPRGSSHGARNLEMEKRAADAEAALLVQQQAHAAVMLRMQAEVQSLQDQLAFARARGDEPSPTNSDDVTLSGQLSRAKTKMAKLEAELSVAKESLQTKNTAISATRLEAQAAMDAGRADRESLKACREALQQAQQDLKNLQRSADAARVGAPPLGGSNVGENAVVASLEAQIARMTSEHVSLAARAAAAEKAANQAKEEARILLRKRQADQSALAQVEADVMAVMSSADGGHTSTTSTNSISAAARVPLGGGGGGVGNVGNPHPQTQHSAHELAGHELAPPDGGVALPAQREGVGGAEEEGHVVLHGMGRGGEDDASENPHRDANPEKHKYEAAIIKIGGLQQKVAELQNVIKSYQKDGKTGVLEMQSVTRSATEAKKELEAERQRRNEERSQLSAQFEQTRKTLEEKLAVAEKARTKLQHVLQKKEEQLDKISEQAQKASTRMKEEMNSMQARHEAAWQRTADAVDRLEGETRTAQTERDAAVKAREQQEERMAFLESENKRLEAAAAEAAGEAQKEVLAAQDGLRIELEGREQECAKRVKEITDESTLKVAALQEQLRAAHDSVADSYAMVAQAQGKCVDEVEKARSKEAASKKELKEAKEQLQAEVKKIQRHLAGVTGVKDTEIERLSTRVSTLEMTGSRSLLTLTGSRSLLKVSFDT